MKINVQNEKVEKRRLVEKAGSYAKYVKEMYWPDVGVSTTTGQDKK